MGSLCVVLAFGASLLGAGHAGADGEAFSNGRATAVAQILRLAPGVGNLQLATTTGQSVSDLANNLAQAKAQSVDLGLIGSSLTAEACDGSPGAVRPEQLPQPTVVDNRSGDASASADDSSAPGGAVDAGREDVEATTTPSALARVSESQATLSSLAQVSNGQSEAITRVVDNNAREAVASVSLDLDIAGVVQLRNLQWQAVHRTGANPNVGGSFSISSAAAGGLPLPTDQLAPLQDSINAALAPSGVSIEMPHVERLTAPNDLVRMTPLRITLKDSPAGKTALGPVLNLTRAQREQLFTAIMSQFCQAAGALLVGDVAVDVVSGTGFMIVEVGGVEASSGDLVIGNPFGDFVPLQQQVEANVAPATATFANGAPATSPATVAAAQASAPDLGPLAAICESLHPTKKPLCSHGMGVPVGIAGLVATASIGFLDWRRQRRLFEPAPDTVTE